MTHVQYKDFPNLLSEKCALLGIPPYPPDNNYEDILLELSEVFKDEHSVFIGELSFTDDSELQWKGTSNNNSHLAFYSRQPKDRSCLLSPKRTKFYASSYQGQLNTDILVQYINEQCNVFRTARGNLNNEGLYLEHLVNNLYTPENEITECKELSYIPSKDEFFKEYLFRSRPVVIKNGYRNSTPYRKWSQDYLRKLYSEKKIHIKLTNNGDFEGVEPVTLWSEHREDYIPPAVRSQLKFPDLVVVRPGTSEMLFSDFLDFISSENRLYSAYLEYSSIPQYMPEIESEVEQLTFVEGLELKHLNMWLSDGNTLGKLHFDPYDNFLVQVLHVYTMSYFMTLCIHDVIFGI